MDKERSSFNNENNSNISITGLNKKERINTSYANLNVNVSNTNKKSRPKSSDIKVEKQNNLSKIKGTIN